MGRRGDFIVDSKGYCFLCLKPPTPLHPAKLKIGNVTESSSINYSLQNISHYLQMDMKEVLDERRSVPPHLLAMVEMSKLKVELCGDCSNLIEKLSTLLRQQEKVQMEVTFYTNLIHGKLAEAAHDDVAGRTGQLRKLTSFDSSKDGLNLQKLTILNVLRKEATQKCSGKLSKAHPRIKVRKLTAKETLKYKSTSRKEKTDFEPMNEDIPEREAKVDDNQVTIKIESSDNDQDDMDHFGDESLVEPEEYSEEDDGGSPTCSVPNSGDEDDKDEAITIEMEDQARPQSHSKVTATNKSKNAKRKKKLTIPRSVINPETGNHECRLCQKEFGSMSGFYGHYKNVHMGIRFKCDKCSSTFAQRGNLWTHKQRCGKVGPFKKICACHLCGKGFTRGRSLQIHLRTIHLDIRAYGCEVCGIAFKRNAHLTVHRNSVHSAQQ